MCVHTEAVKHIHKVSVELLALARKSVGQNPKALWDTEEKLDQMVAVITESYFCFYCQTDVSLEKFIEVFCDSLYWGCVSIEESLPELRA